MGYLMRYVSTDSKQITLAIIETALKKVNPAYAVVNVEVDDLGDLMYGDTRCAIIEINRPGDEIFEDDLAEFKDIVGQGDNQAEQHVHTILNKATALIALEAFWEGDRAEPILAKLDPLWDWLFTNYEGISQADNEGFYDRSGLILERHFTL